MKQRIFGLENEYGLIFSPNGRIYLPMEKVLGYIFEGQYASGNPSMKRTSVVQQASRNVSQIAVQSMIHSPGRTKP